jgi:CRP-like cAMP-binding protein
MRQSLWQTVVALATGDRTPLERSPLLRGLGATEAEEVRRAATSRSIAAGECLFLQGDPVESLFVVESGSLRLVQHTADGEEVVVRTLGGGEIVAGVAILDKRAYPVSALAQTDCRLFVWARPRITELAARHPQIRANVLSTIADRMQEALSRVRELATESVAQRVARALVRLAKSHGRPVPDGVLIDQPLGRQELADLAGASMFTASRLLAGWARDGILDVGRQRVVVRSLDRLEALASAPSDER